VGLNDLKEQLDHAVVCVFVPVKAAEILDDDDLVREEKRVKGNLKSVDGKFQRVEKLRVWIMSSGLKDDDRTVLIVKCTRKDKLRFVSIASREKNRNFNQH